MKKEYFQTFIFSILAGVAIGLGGFLNIIFLSIDQKALGALSFSLGLLLVCSFALFLYTGKIGFFLQEKNKKKYVVLLLIGVIGNIIGATAFGYLLRLVCSDAIMQTANKVAAAREINIGNGGTEFYMSLISSVFCGMLVFIAVYGYKKDWPYYVKILILILCVFAFVFAGFEHCIANAFYISIANDWNYNTILNIVITIVGNSIGALLISGATLLRR